MNTLWRPRCLLFWLFPCSTGSQCPLYAVTTHPHHIQLLSPRLLCNFSFFPSILVYSLCSRPSWRGKTFPQLSKSPYPKASPISPFFLPVFHYHPLFYSSSHSYSSFTSFRLVSTTRPSFLFLTFLFSFLPPLTDPWHSLALHDPTKHTHKAWESYNVAYVCHCARRTSVLYI